MLSGLWKAIRPPPGLLAAALSTARLVGGWCCCLCCRSDKGRRRGRRRKAEAKAALNRFRAGGLAGGPKGTAKPKTGVGDKGRFAAVARSRYFWCFKVPHVCAAFVGTVAADFRARFGQAGGEE